MEEKENEKTIQECALEIISKSIRILNGLDVVDYIKYAPSIVRMCIEYDKQFYWMEP